MTRNLRLILIFSFNFFMLGQLYAQQPEQDCINAIPVCQNVYVQTNSYVGEGLDPNEIDANISCLGSGEENDVWYIFTVQTPGMVSFTVNPINFFDDYDWAVYDITNNSCSDIATNASLEISCNYSATSGPTGPNLPGGAPSNGAGGPNRNGLIPVVAGQTLVVNVSNFSNTSSGYTLDFSASTATIFDNIPPTMDSISANCGGGVEITFSENIVCSTVQPTDFTVTGPGGPFTVTAVGGNNCNNGGTFDTDFLLTVSPLMVQSGTYYISLAGDVEDNCGNIGIYETDSIAIVIPNIAASATQTTVCQGQSTTLSTPSQPGFTYVWSGGNIGATVTINPPITAVYNVFATDPFGCTSTGSVPITVLDTALATFTFSSTSICPDEVIDINFTGSNDPSANFIWDFGGANVISGTGAGPYQVSWTTPGIKSVGLNISQQGCASARSNNTVTVNPSPESDFTVPSNAVCIGNTATITYNGTPSATANYFWDFDGGIVVSGAGAGPYQVSWAVPGPKNISLNVTDNNCVAPTTTKSLTVAANPVASISPIMDQCLKGNSFAFNYNGGATIGNYSWDFGDGSPASTMVNPVHTYTNSGNYTATLNITDINGCSNASTLDVEVYPAVQADFYFSPVCFGQNTGFTDLSNTNGVAIQSWDWDFGNGNTSNVQNPGETYTNFGFFNTRLIVTTAQGCADTLIQQTEVFEQPQANFSFTNTCENLPVNFTETSVVVSSTLSYNWDFGDGQSAAVANPDHQYVGFGTFPVNLIVTTQNGCTDQFQSNIEVYPKPIANVQIDAVCHENPTLFQDLSNVPGGGSIGSYNWDFGNGQASSDANPQLSYDLPGIYDVNLIVGSGEGCLDTTTLSATVYPNPKPDFSMESVCEMDEASFVNLSTIDGSITADVIDQFAWNFGDNSTGSTLENPTHTYQMDGTYQVSLTVTSNKGCDANTTLPLLIYPGPDAPEAVEDTSCFGYPAFLIAQPQPGQDVDHVNWYTEAVGGSPFETNFTFVTPPLTSTQTYYIEAVSGFGCRSARVEINAYTHDESVGRLVVNDSILEIPQAIAEFAVIGGSPITTFDWNFGDGNNSSDSAPVHEYKNAGKYLVTLNYITENGCEGQFSQLIEVKELIVVSIPSAFSPNGDGVNDFFYIGSNLITDIDFKVYNRWGELVFQSQNPDFQWNGFSSEGRRLAEGVYVYLFDGIDIQGRPIERSGTISLFK